MPGPSRIDLRTMDMPELVRTQVFRLLASIEVAETKQAVCIAAQRAEGFVLGLETAGFHHRLTEALYIGFESAAADRIATLPICPSGDW